MNDVLSKRRMEENEAVFRKKNETVTQGLYELEDIAESEGQAHILDDLDIPLMYYCECSDENCRERISIKPSTYSDIHTERDMFIVLPDHEVSPIERVVKKEKGYFIVKKHRKPPENPSKLQSTPVENT